MSFFAITEAKDSVFSQESNDAISPRGLHQLSLEAVETSSAISATFDHITDIQHVSDDASLEADGLVKKGLAAIKKFFEMLLENAKKIGLMLKSGFDKSKILKADLKKLKESVASYSGGDKLTVPAKLASRLTSPQPAFMMKYSSVNLMTINTLLNNLLRFSDTTMLSYSSMVLNLYKRVVDSTELIADGTLGSEAEVRTRVDDLSKAVHGNGFATDGMTSSTMTALPGIREIAFIALSLSDGAGDKEVFQVNKLQIKKHKLKDSLEINIGGPKSIYQLLDTTDRLLKAVDKAKSNVLKIQEQREKLAAVSTKVAIIVGEGKADPDIANIIHRQGKSLDGIPAGINEYIAYLLNTVNAVITLIGIAVKGNQ